MTGLLAARRLRDMQVASRSQKARHDAADFSDLRAPRYRISGLKGGPYGLAAQMKKLYDAAWHRYDEPPLVQLG